MQTRLICLLVELPIIRNFARRKRWQDRWFDSDVTIVPIYNSGRNLLLGTLHGTAITHYDSTHVWHWMRYLDFCEPKYILANKKLPVEKLTKQDMIGIQHLGHDQTGTASIITVGGPRRLTPHRIQIGTKCILFLAVKKGIILGRLQVYQPLPGKIHSMDGRLLWVKQCAFSPKQIENMNSTL